MSHFICCLCMYCLQETIICKYMCIYIYIYIYMQYCDCDLCVGNVEKGVKEIMITRGKEGVSGHTGHILALAVSTDGMYLVRMGG